MHYSPHIFDRDQKNGIQWCDKVYFKYTLNLRNYFKSKGIEYLLSLGRTVLKIKSQYVIAEWYKKKSVKFLVDR